MSKKAAENGLVPDVRPSSQSALEAAKAAARAEALAARQAAARTESVASSRQSKRELIVDFPRSGRHTPSSTDTQGELFSCVAAPNSSSLGFRTRELPKQAQKPQTEEWMDI
eukprot:6085944-Pleurochrysis_carterae.AAC.1